MLDLLDVLDDVPTVFRGQLPGELGSLRTGHVFQHVLGDELDLVDLIRWLRRIGPNYDLVCYRIRREIDHDFELLLLNVGLHAREEFSAGLLAKLAKRLWRKRPEVGAKLVRRALCDALVRVL